MSNQLLNLIWGISWGSPTQQRVMFRFADRADDAGGSIFPSQQCTADEIGVTRRSVSTAVSALEGCGLLKRVARRYRGTIEWQINVPMLEALSEKRAMLQGNSKDLQVIGETCEIISHDEVVDMRNKRQRPVKRTTPTCETGCSQTHKNLKEPSAQARACAGNGSRAALAAKDRMPTNEEPGPDRPPPRRHLPKLTIKQGDPQWSQWQKWLGNEGDYLRETVEELGYIEASSNWPGDDTIVFTEPRQPEVREVAC